MGSEVGGRQHGRKLKYLTQRVGYPPPPALPHPILYSCNHGESLCADISSSMMTPRSAASLRCTDKLNSWEQMKRTHSTLIVCAERDWQKTHDSNMPTSESEDLKLCHVCLQTN